MEDHHQVYTDIHAEDHRSESLVWTPPETIRRVLVSSLFRLPLCLQARVQLALSTTLWSASRDPTQATLRSLGVHQQVHS